MVSFRARCAALFFLVNVLAMGAQPANPAPPRLIPCGGEPWIVGSCGQAAAATFSDSVAVVAGQAVTLGDLDAKARDAVAGLDGEIRRVRREVLEDAIDGRLLEIAARRRGVTADQLYFAEIVKQVAAPTEDQIRSEYAARPELQGNSTFDESREWLSGRLWEKRETELFREWAARARKRVSVAHRADINGSRLQPSTVLALVGGQRITLGSISEPLKARLDGVRQDAYEIQRAAVKKAVDRRLIEAEARKRNTTADAVIRSEITDKIRPVRDEDIAKFFEAHRAEFDGDLASSRAMIADLLKEDAREEAENSFSSRLREGVSVQVNVSQPERLVVAVPMKGSPSRGNPAAPVTVVEFADFECPPCGRMYPQVEEALESYGDRVRIVFRQFPLAMHPHARRAAEASMAARAQGKFWELADRLFRNQKALDEASLRKHATECGLDAERFGRALESESFGAEVVHDIREGRMYGVKWTPTLFVNGVLLRSGTLREAIDAALAKAPGGPPAR